MSDPIRVETQEATGDRPRAATVVGVLVGAQETKVRPAVVIASTTYLAERPDAVVGILTTKLPRTPATASMAWRISRFLVVNTVRR